MKLLLMHKQGSSSNKGLFAQSATVISHPSMWQFVSLEMFRSGERLATSRAKVRSLARVNPPMSNQIAVVPESLITKFTVEWFLLGMDQEMLFVTALLSHTLSTNIADIWFFAGVTHQMSTQRRILTILLPTVLTSIGIVLVVSGLVSTVSISSLELFTTNLAFVVGLVGMKAEMIPEWAIVAEYFSTFLALICLRFLFGKLPCLFFCGFLIFLCLFFWFLLRKSLFFHVVFDSLQFNQKMLLFFGYQLLQQRFLWLFDHFAVHIRSTQFHEAFMADCSRKFFVL